MSVILQKNLTSKFREKFRNVNFGPNIPHLLHFGHNKNFPQKMDFITLM